MKEFAEKSMKALSDMAPEEAMECMAELKKAMSSYLSTVANDLHTKCKEFDTRANRIVEFIKNHLS